MGKIGNTILKAIYNNKWVKIEYENTNGETTKFAIGINNIDYKKEFFSIDSFNIAYKYETENRFIYYSGIKSADIMDRTFHKTPDELLKNLYNNKENYAFLDEGIDGSDLIDYYIDCFKMDTTPFVNKYKLIPGIDSETLIENVSYVLNDEQFKIFSDDSYFEKDNKEKRKNNGRTLNELVLNILSLETNKGLYVLAYKNLLLDINSKSLVANNKIVINKEFSYNPTSREIETVDSIRKYLPEEDIELLDNYQENEQKIIESIREYNHTKTSTYNNDLHIDTRPFMVVLGKMLTADIEAELFGIKRMIYNDIPMSGPIKTFLGNPVKARTKKNEPIFTVDDRYNIDQINAINVGIKSTCSYIEGPPGTGKTKTLLNAIVTEEFNGKTVLVSSNNNVPMDGIYESIRNLKYRDTDIELLFPAIRLGSFDYLNEAMDRILDMYSKSLKLIPKESIIKSIKKEREKKQEPLAEFLLQHEILSELYDRKNSLEIVLRENANEMFKLRIEAQIEEIKSEIKKIGMIDINKFNEYMEVDYKSISTAINYETAGNLQKLGSQKYNDLMIILKMPKETDDEKKKRVDEFKKYLSNPTKLKLFQEIFHVIITTNLSSGYLGEASPSFDILMMDEAGQCNIANALIPISRCKQLMLVGDPQQIKPVIVLDKSINQSLKDKYHIPEEYDYINNSIYTAFTTIDIINNETLLSYHYRCNNKIINFSNKKYYHSKLKIFSKSKEKNPLVFVDTEKLDLKNEIIDKNVSIPEINEIVKYIKSNSDKSIGIITPFVKQKEYIEKALKENNFENIPVGTVHAFQGDEKEVILFSTAITNKTGQGSFKWLMNNRELINVAVSRATDKLIMFGNKKAIDLLSNERNDLQELSDYIISNGESVVTDVSIPSIALGTRQISTESEEEFRKTVEHALSVLNENCFIKTEVSVSSIFSSIGNDSRLFYMERFDMVIFEKVFGKNKILMAIELDGPEHLTDNEVIERDKKKEEFCKKHNFPLYKIPRDCARNYSMIKDTLKSIVKL